MVEAAVASLRSIYLASYRIKRTGLEDGLNAAAIYRGFFNMDEPHISFQHAAFKIIWAGRLLTQLNQEITSFTHRKPYKITLEPEPDGESYLLQVNLTEAIPHTIPCLIGDICHNLRASGDFCWMGLLRSKIRDAPKSTLPICSNAKGIENTVARILDGRTLEKAIDLLVYRIKSHQDFQSGGSVSLSDLNHLSNWQKHNMLVPSFGVTELGDNTIIRSNDGSFIDLSLAKVSGRVAGIGGTKAEMSYSTPHTVKMFVDLKYAGRSHPVTESIEIFRRTMVHALYEFCQLWPSDNNPAFNESSTARVGSE